ncbi:MAG: apolipoprotein N-acyltransferase [Rickettsiales bacterium]|jgi:apolipoprotein N-acyltransferase|nr:apolipoprotein N-acyltransferase [Rickettsiales bacterium]
MLAKKGSLFARLAAGFGMVAIGYVGSFGFAPNYLWPLTVLSIAAAYYLSENKGYGIGFWWGAGYGCAVFSWALHFLFASSRIVDNPWQLYSIGFISLGLYCGLLFGMPFFLTAKTSAAGWRRTVCFALAWTLVLWFREYFVLGFPMNPIANLTLPSVRLSGLLSVFGTVGLTFVLVGCICAVPEYIRTKSKWQFLFLVPLLMCFFVPWQSIKSADMTVRIVQPAISTDEKLDSAKRKRNLETLIDLSVQKNGIMPDLIIWPETIYPYVVNDVVKMPSLGIPYIAGVNYRKLMLKNGVYNPSYGDLYNKMWLMDKNGNLTDSYAKSTLLPFGEYQPLPFLPSLGKKTPGDGPKIIQNFVPSICYEIIFSDRLVVGEPEFIVNISDDNWFGASRGPYLHLDMARNQAIETGLPVIRANQSGISAVIDSRGRIVKSLGLYEKGIIDAKVPPAEMTVYRKIGLNKTMLGIILLSGFILVAFRKKKN